MSLPPVAKNNKGFSLIEMMIAVVIVLISMLALLTAIVSSMHTNVMNEHRNMAIRLANQTAEAILALQPFTDAEISSGTHSRTSGNSAQNLRGFPDPIQTIRGKQQTFGISWEVTPPTDKSKQVVITIEYTYRNQPATHTSAIYKFDDEKK